MEDVAARAGVSRALVSIVFRDAPGASADTRSRVRAAADELGYEPDRRASRLGRSRTRMIGVVFAFDGDFHAEVVDGLYTAAEQFGYEIVLSASTRRRSEDDAVRAVLAERCEGAVLIGSRLPTRRIAELAERVPTVVLLRHLRLAGVDTVRTDERAGMELLVDHLAGLGHQRILHLDGGSAPGAAQRRQAYREAMSRRGLIPRLLTGGLDEESGAEAADLIARAGPDERPTAITAFNDRCALGVLHRLRGNGFEIPEDLSLTGFDDIPAAGHRHLQLTTVHQDADQLGRRAIVRLRDRLEQGQDAEPAVPVPARLVIRGTTAPLRVRRRRR